MRKATRPLHRYHATIASNGRCPPHKIMIRKRGRIDPASYPGTASHCSNRRASRDSDGYAFSSWSRMPRQMVQPRHGKPMPYTNVRSPPLRESYGGPPIAFPSAATPMASRSTGRTAQPSGPSAAPANVARALMKPCKRFDPDQIYQGAGKRRGRYCPRTHSYPRIAASASSRCAGHPRCRAAKDYTRCYWV